MKKLKHRFTKKKRYQKITISFEVFQDRLMKHIAIEYSIPTSMLLCAPGTYLSAGKITF